jgi:hypothetical protein
MPAEHLERVGHILAGQRRSLSEPTPDRQHEFRAGATPAAGPCQATSAPSSLSGGPIPANASKASSGPQTPGSVGADGCDGPATRLDEQQQHRSAVLVLDEGGCRAVRDRGAADTFLFLRRGSLPNSIAVLASTWRADAGLRNEALAPTAACIAARRIAAPTPSRKADSPGSMGSYARDGETRPESPTRSTRSCFTNTCEQAGTGVRPPGPLSDGVRVRDLLAADQTGRPAGARGRARLTSRPRPRRRRDCPRRGAGRSSRGRRRSRPRSRSGTPRVSPESPSSS